MAEPRLIRDYLATLSAELPASIVTELADGLAETHQAYVSQGLAPDRAAESAVAEFGDPKVIVAEFSRVNPAGRAARRLLATGPLVGACWAVALVSNRAWAWPVPVPVRILAGVALITIIGLLATAARATRYRLAARAGTAGCLGITALDVALISGVMLTAPAVTWLTAAAMVASTARVAFSALTVRPL